MFMKLHIWHFVMLRSMKILKRTQDECWCFLCVYAFYEFSSVTENCKIHIFVGLFMLTNFYARSHNCILVSGFDQCRYRKNNVCFKRVSIEHLHNKRTDWFECGVWFDQHSFYMIIVSILWNFENDLNEYQSIVIFCINAFWFSVSINADTAKILYV